MWCGWARTTVTRHGPRRHVSGQSCASFGCSSSSGIAPIARATGPDRPAEGEQCSPRRRRRDRRARRGRSRRQGHASRRDIRLANPRTPETAASASSGRASASRGDSTDRASSIRAWPSCRTNAASIASSCRSRSAWPANHWRNTSWPRAGLLLRAPGRARGRPVPGPGPGGLTAPLDIYGGLK